MKLIANYKGHPLQLIYLDQHLLAEHLQNAANPLPPSSVSANAKPAPTAAPSSLTNAMPVKSTATNSAAKPLTTSAKKSLRRSFPRGLRRKNNPPNIQK